MKTSTRFLTSLCLGAASAQVHIPLSRYDGNLDRIARRDNTQFGLHSADYLYVANISVGTPGQPMQVVISQASDTWVPDASISYCDPEYYSYYKDDPKYAYLYNQYKDYCKWGTFNKTVSSTYAAANVKYRTFYTYDVTGSYVSGDNFTDNLSIGGITLENYSIGLVDSANNYIGILGLGQNRSYTSSSSSSSSGKYTYTHFLDKLVEQDKIKSAAYSIWLDDAEGKSGNLLLGAIDTSKFDGTLTRLSAYQSSYYIPSYSFGVELSAINGTDKSSASKQPLTGNDFPLPMAIDTATAMSYFPTSLAGKLWSMAGATYNRTLGYATIPCNADGSAEFDFQLAGSSGPILNVQLKDLIFSRSVLPYSYQSYLNNTETCIFGIQNISSSSSYSYSNIGSGLLRRTYLVVDTENLEIAVAPVKFGSTASSNVVSFAARAAVAPSATMYCGSTSSYYCKSTCTANCNPTSTARSSSSPTSGSGGGSSSGTSISSLYGWQQAAIGVGITFGIIILLALGAAAVIWRRAIRKDNAPAAKMLEDETVEYLPPPPGMTGPAGAPADRGLNPIGEEPQMTSAPQLPPLPPRGGDLNADIHPPREPSPLSDTGHEAVAAEQQPPAGESKEPEVIPKQPTERPPSPPSPVVEGKGKAPETQAS